MKKQANRFSFILSAGILSLGLFLTGCNQANKHMGSSTNRTTGRAMVQGSEQYPNQTRSESQRESNVASVREVSPAEQMQQCKNLMKEKLGKADSQYDERFIDMTISQNQSTIDIAKDAQQKAQHPEIKKLAQNIIDTQQKQIQELKSWRKSWYGSEKTATTSTTTNKYR